MQKLTYALSFLLYFSSLFAQNQWAFMGGHQTHDAPWLINRPSPTPDDYHGASMQFDVTFKPAAREHAGGGLTGNEIYLYSGQKLSGNADLWVFDISTNRWAWIEDYSDNPDYSNNSNAHPGKRNRMASAVDPQGNIWIFGGQYNNSPEKADLWKFSPVTKEWTYVDGPTNDNFRGNWNGNPWPDCRYRVRSWFDSNGIMWMFGGCHDVSGGRRSFNDLWSYNPTTNQWNCVSGNPDADYAPTDPGNGSYNGEGTVGHPKARGDYGYWQDNNGDFWIYGGYGKSHEWETDLGDLWKYDRTNQSWIQVKGDATPIVPRNFGAAIPGSRNCPLSWKGNDGNLYMFGGAKDDHFIMDMWKFDIGANQWVVVNANGNIDGTATINTFQTDDPSNWPGSKVSPLSNMNNGTHVYMLDGYGTGTNASTITGDGVYRAGYNCPLWRYSLTPPTSCNITSASVSNQSCTGGNQYFSLTVGGNNTGSGYTVSGFPGGYSGNTTGSYGAAVSFGPVATASFPLNLTITDNATGTCTRNVNVTATSCPVFAPNIQMTITQDNFDPLGASPYTNSTREVTLENIGNDVANNVVIDLGLSNFGSYSAMQLSNIQVLDGSNNPVSGISLSGDVWSRSNDPAGFPCASNPSDAKSTIHVTIPSIAAGATVRVRAIADHCMANFNHTGSSFYTWNYWAAEGSYQDASSNNYVLRVIENETAQTLQENNSNARVDNNSAQALWGYFWTAYQGAWSPITVSSGTQNFTIQLGSGSQATPSDYQDRGASYTNSRTRLDLTLPLNVTFASNGFADITAEYAVNNGSSAPLTTVSPDAINLLQTLPDGSRVYEVLFPVNQHIAVRRMFVNLTAASTPSGSYNVKARMRTTYNNSFASSTYGWKPESDEYSYLVNSTGFPVELLSFTGEVLNGNVSLSWVTASESNNSGFEIEKSLNGNDFQKIGFVNGAGTTSTMQNYGFTDYNFSGRAWYRLNQIDYDGKATNSNVVELSTENLSFNISPNPLANGIATISLPAGENRKVAVYNAIGEKVLELKVDQDVYTLNLNAYSEGIYSVVCSVEGKKQVLKVKR